MIAMKALSALQVNVSWHPFLIMVTNSAQAMLAMLVYAQQKDRSRVLHLARRGPGYARLIPQRTAEPRFYHEASSTAERG